MKKYLTILILFFSFTASAQIIYTPMSAGGYQIKYLKTDSGFALPFRDTTIGRGADRPGLMVINYADSLPYYYNGRFWKPVYVDSTGVIELINNKVDSVTVNGNNLFYWVAGLGYGAQLNKLDSIHVSADSIFTCIAGNCTFQYLTTAGTGTVTSIMAGFGLTGDTITTTGIIAVDTSVFHTSNWNNATYAPIVHFHSASDIISGTLPIVRGGTGLSGIGAPHQFLRVSASGTSLEYYTSSVGNADSLGGHPASYYATNTALGLKLNISDTTNKWIQDVYTRADSLFKLKNGEETFLREAGISQSTIDSILGGYYTRSQVDSIAAQLRTEGRIDSAAFHIASLNSDSTQLSLIRPNGTSDIIPLPFVKKTDTSITVISHQGVGLQTIYAGTDTIYAKNIHGVGGITVTTDIDSSLVITGSSGTGKVYAGGHLANTNDSTLNADTLSTNLRDEIALKQDALTLTTTGTSGAATLSGSTLNIPQYTGGAGGSSIDSITPNLYAGLGYSDTKKIQLALDLARSKNQKLTIANNYERNSNVWMIDSAILLNSNEYIIIRNATLKLTDSSRDNIFRTANCGIGITNPGSNPMSGITIEGIGNAVLEGADNPRASGDMYKSLTLTPGFDYTTSYGTDAGKANRSQYGDWRNYGVIFAYTSNVRVTGLKLNYLHAYGVSFSRCSNVVVRDITANMPGYSANGDTTRLIKNNGTIDFNQNVNDITVENVHGTSHDDAVACNVINLPHYAGDSLALYPTGDTTSVLIDSINNVNVNNINVATYSNVVRIQTSGDFVAQNVSITNITNTLTPNTPVYSGFSGIGASSCVSIGISNATYGYGNTLGKASRFNIRNLKSSYTQYGVIILGSLTNSVISDIIKDNPAYASVPGVYCDSAAFKMRSVTITNSPGYPSVTTLKDSAIVKWDYQTQGKEAKVTLGGNRTLSISNLPTGQVAYLTLEVIQDATGARTLTLQTLSKVINGGSGGVSLSTAAGAIDILSLRWDGTTLFWTIGKNYN